MKKLVLEYTPILYAVIAGLNLGVGNYGSALFVSLLAIDLIAHRISDAARGES